LLNVLRDDHVRPSLDRAEAGLLGHPGIGARLAAPPGLSQPSTPESDDA
jgi:hypothetical protein